MIHSVHQFEGTERIILYEVAPWYCQLPVSCVLLVADTMCIGDRLKLAITVDADPIGISLFCSPTRIVVSALSTMTGNFVRGV